MKATDQVDATVRGQIGKVTLQLVGQGSSALDPKNILLTFTDEATGTEHGPIPVSWTSSDRQRYEITLSQLKVGKYAFDATATDSAGVTYEAKVSGVEVTKGGLAVVMMLLQPKDPVTFSNYVPHISGVYISSGSVAPGDTVTFTAKWFDDPKPDPDPAEVFHYVWTRIDGGAFTGLSDAVLPATPAPPAGTEFSTSIAWTAPADANGDYRFTFKVSDRRAGQDLATAGFDFQINVSPANATGSSKVLACINPWPVIENMTADNTTCTSEACPFKGAEIVPGQSSKIIVNWDAQTPREPLYVWSTDCDGGTLTGIASNPPGYFVTTAENNDLSIALGSAENRYCAVRVQVYEPYDTGVTAGRCISPPTGYPSEFCARTHRPEDWADYSQYLAQCFRSGPIEGTLYLCVGPTEQVAAPVIPFVGQSPFHQAGDVFSWFIDATSTAGAVSYEWYYKKNAAPAVYPGATCDASSPPGNMPCAAVLGATGSQFLLKPCASGSSGDSFVVGVDMYISGVSMPFNYEFKPPPAQFAPVICP
jgi:hypothetical protein